MADMMPLPTPARQADPLSRLDGCPGCVANTELPILSHPIEGGSVAFYECSDCGHRWSTAWGEC